MKSTSLIKNNQQSYRWQKLINWARKNHQFQSFKKEELIPMRSGFIHLVETGLVRIMGNNSTRINLSLLSTENKDNVLDNTETFLGFIGEGHFFEVIEHTSLFLQPIAHIHQTNIIWFKDDDLANFPQIKEEITNNIRYQNHRKLLWLNNLSQSRTIDRLLGYLTLLMEEFGQPCSQGYYLPFNLTHSNIASAICTTRVTVTKLMTQLRQQGIVQILRGNHICLPKLVIIRKIPQV